MHNYIVIIGGSVGVPQVAPFFDPICCKTDGPAAEAVGAPSIEIHEVAAHGVEVVHIVGFETPGGAEAVGNIPPCAELAAAVCPAAVE